MVSHSRIETFNKCKYQYKLRYIDKVKTFFNGEADNPLIIGTALHTGLEKDAQTAIEEYYSHYPIITDKHIEEAMKLEAVIYAGKAVLPRGEFEVEIRYRDFIGYIDLLVPVGEDTFDLYDFKYSNNVENYMKSGQLHEYKYFFEKSTCKKIRNMFFLFIPKTQIRIKKQETESEFRRRLKSELESKAPRLELVPYNVEKVKDFLRSVKNMRYEKAFNKTESALCRWCEYFDYCTKGDTLNIDYKEHEENMNLPKNEKRVINAVNTYKKIWLYGVPFSGKTYLANQFPSPLMLNTDGNIKYIDAPYIAIKDVVTLNGRLTERVYAWQIFKDAITELEKKDNTFETIVVDLLEDTYELCRLYMYKKLGIEHESDDSFRAWDKIRIEFLSTIKRLLNLDYNIILLSHEDSSKDITKKSGDKITSIKPNLQDKTALKVAGMVDIVCRIINDEGTRTISFKTNEVIFGGGRLNISHTEIPCTYEDLMSVYGVNSEKKEDTRPQVMEAPKDEDVPPIESDLEELEEVMALEESTPIEESIPKTRRRRV